MNYRTKFQKEEFGCLTYGEGYELKRLRLGSQLNNFNYFLCAERMCNMRMVSRSPFFNFTYVKYDRT